MEKYSKESKNVHEAEYSKETKELHITFKGFKDPKRLTKYVYSNVPEKVWEELKKAESLGSFVNKNIVKGGYAYEKIG